MSNSRSAKKSTANVSKLSATLRGHRTHLAAKSSPIKSGSASGRRLLSRDALRCRRKFLQFYPGGYRDRDYVELERNYKWNAHEKWCTTLDRITYSSLLRSKKFHRLRISRCPSNRGPICCSHSRKWRFAMPFIVRPAPVLSRRPSMSICTAPGQMISGLRAGVRRSMLFRMTLTPCVLPP